MVFLNVTLIVLLLLTKCQTPTEGIGGQAAAFDVIHTGHNEEYPDEPVAFIYLFLHADGDCDCLEDWSNWVHLHAQFSDQVAIKGIFNGSDEGKMRDFARELDLPFRIYKDNNKFLQDEYHVMPRQIVKIVLSREGNLIYSDTYQAHPSDQAYFLKRVRSLIDWING